MSYTAATPETAVTERDNLITALDLLRLTLATAPVATLIVE